MISTSDRFITIIFSKDRPLQLDLTLTSNERHCSEKNARNEVVIYKPTNDEFEETYKQVAKEHPDVQFLKEDNFKNNLLECVDKNRHVMFVVDDCIFTRRYSLDKISSFLDICDGVLGFSLRLGTNTEVCYPIREKNDMPYMQMLGKNIGAFSWKQAGKGDFSYPLDVSSSVYRVKDIKPLLEKLDYNTPNSLEWMLSNSTRVFNNLQFLLCYDISPAFCNPINKVQTENNNRVGNVEGYGVEPLLLAYNLGYRIDADAFDGFISNGCHQEVPIRFIKKEN